MLYSMTETELSALVETPGWKGFTSHVEALYRASANRVATLTNPQELLKESGRFAVLESLQGWAAAEFQRFRVEATRTTNGHKK